MSNLPQDLAPVRLEPHAANRKHYLMVLADRFPGVVGGLVFIGEFDRAVFEGIAESFGAVNSATGNRAEVFQAVYERIDASAVSILALTLSMVSD